MLMPCQVVSKHDDSSNYFWSPLGPIQCQKLGIEFRKPCPFPVWFLRLRHVWSIEHSHWDLTSLPPPAFYFSSMQLISFVAVHIDSAFVTQEKKPSDVCVCCMKRCHSLDKRWWSACITVLGAARLGLWCADHHLCHWPSLKVSGYKGFRLASGQLSPCAIATVQREIGKTRSFSKTTTRDWGKTAQNLSVSNSFSWGIQAKLLCTLFDCSPVLFFLHPSHWPLIIVLRGVPVEGATWLGGGVSCQFRNSAGQGIDAVVISSAINREDFFSVSEVSLNSTAQWSLYEGKRTPKQPYPVARVNL